MELQQCLREPALQSQKHNVLDLLAGSAQSSADKFNELHRDIRILPHHRDEIATVNNHQFAVFNSYGIGGPRAAIEQRDLAEQLSGWDDVEYGVLALLRRNAD